MKLTKEQIFGMYLGQKIVVRDSYEYKLTGITQMSVTKKDYIIYSEKNSFSMSDCKLLLRTYEDMTEEERSILSELDDVGGLEEITPLDGIYFTRKQFDYLISIGIDVFGAIEQGYAIRKEETK